MTPISQMLREIRETPALAAAAMAQDAARYAELGEVLRARCPRFAATIARGSSDHAAGYAASLIGIRAGRATASLPPSFTTRYGAQIDLSGALVLAISQSGVSPDLVESLSMARRSGGLTVAIVNVDDSPLARQAEWTLPQRAGPEQAVAATKSFVLSLIVVARLIAAWTEDKSLSDALQRLPEFLAAALECDWSAGWEVFSSEPQAGAFVVSRGPALAVAQEAALKLKETSYLHSEALSSAEMQHGPFAVVDFGFPVLAFALEDAGGEDTRDLLRQLAGAGARVMTACHRPIDAGIHLPLPSPLHPLLDPIVAVLAFYPFAEALARLRGLDPDHPRNLRKVTRTV